METKTIALDVEAYEILRRHKRRGESFSDVVKRLAGSRRPLVDLAGLWKDMSPTKFRRFEESRRRGREQGTKRLARSANNRT